MGEEKIFFICYEIVYKINDKKWVHDSDSVIVVSLENKLKHQTKQNRIAPI